MPKKKVKQRVQELRWVPASELIPHSKNWREHPKAQQDAMAGVLAEIGFANAVIARETPEGLQLIDGHLRHEMMGNEPIPVLVVDVTEEEADQLLVTLDPLALMANSNTDNLLELLATTQFESQAVNDMLEALANGETQPLPPLHEPEDDPGAQIDKAEELREKWGVERGQVWIIGDAPGLSYRKPHRLMCGDCTTPDIDVLLGGTSPEMVFTDPPYNALKSWNKDSANSETRLDPSKWFENDNMDWPEYRGFLTAALGQAPGHSIYVCCDYRIYPIVVDTLVVNDWEVKHCIVWKKNSFGLGKRYRFQHEFIVYACKGEAPFYGDRSQSDVWEIDKAAADDGIHSTMKPLGVPAKAIANSSDNAAVVLDMFLGSGTTMVAAEQLGRICYGMELEPKYVAVTLERMAGMGLEPKLLDA